MGKISQWLIDKEERGEVIYDEQRKRYQDRAGAVARSASEGDAESECVRGHHESGTGGILFHCD